MRKTAQADDSTFQKVKPPPSSCNVRQGIACKKNKTVKIIAVNAPLLGLDARRPRSGPDFFASADGIPLGRALGQRVHLPLLTVQLGVARAVMKT